MGGTVSLQPEIFASAREEYEAKKSAGLSDEELFNHMKTFIEAKTAEHHAAHGTHHKEGEHGHHKEGHHAGAAHHTPETTTA